jgi:hypothetical protein
MKMFAGGMHGTLFDEHIAQRVGRAGAGEEVVPASEYANPSRRASWQVWGADRCRGITAEGIAELYLGSLHGIILQRAAGGDAF